MRPWVIKFYRSLTPCRKESVTPGIKADMKQKKHCNPEDMVKFLLALCCQDNPSATLDKDVDKRLNDCYKSVLPLANCNELRERLET